MKGSQRQEIVPRHISEEVMGQFVKGGLSGKEERRIMEHVAQCGFCAGRLAGCMEKTELLMPPPGLKQEILQNTVYRKETFAAADKIWKGKMGNWGELFCYSVKVAFAVCVSITMLFTLSIEKGGMREIDRMPEEIMQVQQEVGNGRGILGKDNGFMQGDSEGITDSLQDISQKAGETLSAFWKWVP